MVSDQDLAALQGFVDETNESLQDIGNAFIELENDPANLDIITRIFRPVHSMKGNSGFFGLTHINRFAHRLEDLLDFIRKGEILVDKEVIDILLTGVEYLQGMMDRIFDDLDDVTLRPDEEKFLVEKVETCQPQKVPGSLQSVLDLEQLLHQAEEFSFSTLDDSLVASTLEHIAKCNTYLMQVIEDKKKEAEPPLFVAECTYHFQDKDYTSQVRCFGVVAETLASGQHVSGELLASLKNALSEVGKILAKEEGVKASCDELIPLLNFIDDELMAASSDFASTVTNLLRELTKNFTVHGGEPEAGRIGEILVEQGKIDPDQLTAALEKQEMVGEILVKEGTISEQDLKTALDSQDKETLAKHVKSKKSQSVGKTIRIDQFRLDSFADTVGDLFIALDSFNYLQKQIEATDAGADIITRFTNTITTMDDMVSHLQEDIMSVRKVPVKGLFQRFPQVIRKLSASLDKKIDLRLRGEDAVIDKDLLEDIENPLVHILRNSVDHGIEMPEDRENANKPATGTLNLSALVDDQYVNLVIEDDGNGIDPQKMKKIAVKKGFMRESEVNKLSDKELVNLIFKPGFSSAEKVSDVSGRGVGMDVVMSALQKNNGVIDVESVVGQGTKVTITIPLTRTLVTKEALIVKSSDQFFAIPSDAITTTVYPEENFVNILEDHNGLAYNDTIMRVVDMNDFFYGEPSSADQVQDQVLVVCAEKQIALLVDQIFNHQQIVVKVFAGGYRQFDDIPGIYGYTILGNEDIVLILDPEKIAREA